MKKIACIILALLLLASSTAFAASGDGEGVPVLPGGVSTGEEPSSSGALEITGEVAVPDAPAEMDEQQPVISVSVPDSGCVVVNPYRLEVVRDGIASNQQIVSPAMVLQNRSAVPVRVDAKATGTVPPGSEAELVPFAPPPDAAGKEVFLFLEFQGFWGNDPLWSGQFTDGANQLAVGSQGTAKEGVMTMEAGGAGALRVFGAAAEAPAEPWTAADTVNVSVVFTFAALD